MPTDQYDPITEHAGLKQDGTPDKRVGTGEFAQGQVDPHAAGQKGGLAAGHASSDNAGAAPKGGRLTKTDASMQHRSLIVGAEFAHGKVNPAEAGRLGGLATAAHKDSSSNQGGRLTESCTPYQLLTCDEEFAHGKVDPHEAGRLGGLSGKGGRFN